MAASLLTQPVLAEKPAANCNVYIVGLLDELRQRIDRLPVVPGAPTVQVATKDVHELRGAFTAASVAIRNMMKWAS